MRKDHKHMEVTVFQESFSCCYPHGVLQEKIYRKANRNLNLSFCHILAVKQKNDFF